MREGRGVSLGPITWIGARPNAPAIYCCVSRARAFDFEEGYGAVATMTAHRGSEDPPQQSLRGRRGTDGASRRRGGTSKERIGSRETPARDRRTSLGFGV